MNVFFILLMVSFSAISCPSCGGSATEFDNKIVMIIGIFTLLIYIPMSILFRMAMNKKSTVPNNRNDC